MRHTSLRITDEQKARWKAAGEALKLSRADYLIHRLNELSIDDIRNFERTTVWSGQRKNFAFPMKQALMEKVDEVTAKGVTLAEIVDACIS